VRALAVAALLLLAAGPIPAAPETIDAGVRLFEARRFPEAKAFFEKLAAVSPPSAEADYYLGRLFINEDDYDQAIAWLAKAVALRDGSSEYHLWLGRAYAEKTLISNIFRRASLAPKVREQFERAVEIDPNNLDARLNLVDFHLQAPGIVGGSLDKAIEQAAEIGKRDPIRGHVASGRIDHDQKKDDEAEREYLAAIREAPASPLPRLELGGLYQALGRYDDAVRVFEEIVAADPNQMVAMYQIGRTGVLSGKNLDRAAECLRTYLRYRPGDNDPNLGWAHFRLGQVLELGGSADGAKREYEAAVAADPRNKEAKAALRRISGPAPR
jgi:tetratricopeptide (TPR) repeat protein